MNILGLSYPRSGASWLQSIIEHIKSDDDTYEKVHFISKQKPDKLIVLVRDFKECLVRHSIEFFEPNKFLKDLPKSLSKTAKQIPVSYLHPLYYYHDFAGEKLIIYYEDLILQEGKTVQMVADFICADKIKTNMFLSAIDSHRSHSLKHYANSYTYGQFIYHHREKLTIPQLYEMDKIIFSHCDKHLHGFIKRYKEAKANYYLYLISHKFSTFVNNRIYKL